MAKVEIEVPKGKIANIDYQSNGNVLVTFEEAEHWKSIKSVGDAINYLESKDMCADLINEYRNTPCDSYSKKLTAYRIVVAALTNNEQRHLTTGERWFPVIQFCKPGKEKNCWGSKIIGTIESEGQKYSVVGGGADGGANAGLGCFSSDGAGSGAWTAVGFRSVSRCEIALHISEHFGRLLFDVHYGGVNCDMKWVN